MVEIDDIKEIIHKSNGCVIPAVLKMDGSELFIINGEVRLNTDGSVDIDNSDESIDVFVVRSGFKGEVNPAYIRLSEPRPPEQVKDILNKLPEMKPGDEFVIFLEGVECTVRVIERCSDGERVIVSVNDEKQHDELISSLQMLYNINLVEQNKDGFYFDWFLVKDYLTRKKSKQVDNEVEKIDGTLIKKPQSNKERFTDRIWNIGCWVIMLALFCGLLFKCGNDWKEGRAKRNRQEFIADSIAQRRQFEKDSIDSVKNTPEYKARMDSIHLALEKKREETEKSTIVMIAKGDSLYHFMTMCIYDYDVGKISLMSEYNAKRLGFKECYHCVRDLDEYIAVEDISEFIRENYDKWEIIDLFDITSDDFW